MKSLPCPLCAASIEFIPIDGECVVCSSCALDCEIHVSTVFDESSGEERPIVLLEPLAEFQHQWMNQ